MGRARAPLTLPFGPDRPARARPSLRNRARRNPVATRRAAAALVVAACTALLLANVVGGAERTRQQWGRSVPVVVARATLRPGDALAEATRVERWPAALVPRSALSRLGPGARAAAAIDAGTPVTRALVVGTAAAQRPSGASDRRRIALVLAGPRLAVRAGEVVDVWATSDGGTGTGLTATTRRIAHAAVVLRAGVHTVVVAVTRSEEVATAAAAASATITLTAPA